jgi:hypothetical protein
MTDIFVPTMMETGLVALELLTSLLYGVKASDPSMLLAPAAVLLITALLARKRALRIDPAAMLRSE